MEDLGLNMWTRTDTLTVPVLELSALDVSEKGIFSYTHVVPFTWLMEISVPAFYWWVSF